MFWLRQTTRWRHSVLTSSLGCRTSTPASSSPRRATRVNVVWTPSVCNLKGGSNFSQEPLDHLFDGIDCTGPPDLKFGPTRILVTQTYACNLFKYVSESGVTSLILLDLCLTQIVHAGWVLTWQPSAGQRIAQAITNSSRADTTHTISPTTTGGSAAINLPRWSLDLSQALSRPWETWQQAHRGWLGWVGNEIQFTAAPTSTDGTNAQ